MGASRTWETGMSTLDSRLATELRFGPPVLEPSRTLLEQLSALATASATAKPARRRSPKRAAAGMFAGLLLASGTAYAAHEQIEPVLSSIVGESRPAVPKAPHPSVSPARPGDTTSARLSPAGQSSKAVSARRSRPHSASAIGEDQQPSSGETQQPLGSDAGTLDPTTRGSGDSGVSLSGTSTPGETASTSDAGSSSGGGTSAPEGGSLGSLDGPSAGQ